MQRCFLLTVFVLLLVSCSAPTATPTPLPQATYTPLPTYTPYPTFTPVSQPTAQVVARPMNTATPKPTASSQAPSAASAAASTSTPASTPNSNSTSTPKCIAWTDATDHMNETTCVRGTVYSAIQNGSTFFINFDNTRASFYAVSFNYTWDNLKGKCIEISGKIVLYNGRPEIVIDKQDQLKMCQ